MTVTQSVTLFNTTCDADDFQPRWGINRVIAWDFVLNREDGTSTTVRLTEKDISTVPSFQSALAPQLPEDCTVFDWEEFLAFIQSQVRVHQRRN